VLLTCTNQVVAPAVIVGPASEMTTIMAIAFAVHLVISKHSFLAPRHVRYSTFELRVEQPMTSVSASNALAVAMGPSRFSLPVLLLD